MPSRDEENSIAEIKENIKKDEENVTLIEESTNSEEKEEESGYLAVIKNVPFLCVMLANLPAVMGLYIPYMFLPGVSHQIICSFPTFLYHREQMQIISLLDKSAERPH